MLAIGIRCVKDYESYSYTNRRNPDNARQKQGQITRYLDISLKMRNIRQKTAFNEKNERK